MDIRLLYSKHAFLRSELDLEASDFSWDVDLCDIDILIYVISPSLFRDHNWDFSLNSQWPEELSGKHGPTLVSMAEKSLKCGGDLWWIPLMVNNGVTIGRDQKGWGL